MAEPCRIVMYSCRMKREALAIAGTDNLHSAAGNSLPKKSKNCGRLSQAQREQSLFKRNSWRAASLSVDVIDHDRSGR